MEPGPLGPAAAAGGGVDAAAGIVAAEGERVWLVVVVVVWRGSASRPRPLGEKRKLVVECVRSVVVADAEVMD